MSLPEKSYSATEIDINLIRELLEAGNDLAVIVDELRGRSLETERDKKDAVALLRWESALFAIGKAVH